MSKNENELRFSFKRRTVEWFNKNHPYGEGLSFKSFYNKFWRRVNRVQDVEFIEEVIQKEKELDALYDIKLKRLMALHKGGTVAGKEVKNILDIALPIPDEKSAKEHAKLIKERVVAKAKTSKQPKLIIRGTPKGDPLGAIRKAIAPIVNEDVPEDKVYDLPEDLTELNVTFDEPITPTAKFERKSNEIYKAEVPGIPELNL